MEGQRRDAVTRLTHRLAQFGNRQNCGRHSSDHAGADGNPVRVWRHAEAYVAGSNDRQHVEVVHKARRTDGLAIGPFDLEALRYGRRDRQGCLDALAAIATVIVDPPVGGDSQGKRIASDQAFDRLGRRAGLILVSTRQRRVSLPDPDFANPG